MYTCSANHEDILIAKEYLEKYFLFHYFSNGTQFDELCSNLSVQVSQSQAGHVRKLPVTRG